MHVFSLARRKGVRAAALAALLALPAALAGCGDFLEVENPGFIEEPKLSDSTYIPLMVNGVIGEYQATQSVYAYRTAVFTDELRNHFGAAGGEEYLFDQRRVTPDNGTHSFFLYAPMQRTRFLADSVASRLRGLLADSAGRDRRLARVQAYSGHSYLILAEGLCNSPIDVSAPLPPDSLFNRAIVRFDDAIRIATAAKAVAGAPAAVTLSADSIINFARVGAARAYLNMGNMAKALELARPVPAAFEFRASYSKNSTRETSEFFRRMVTPAWASLSNTPFEAIKNDPRVPRPATLSPVQGGSGFVPRPPSSFSGYTATLTGGEWTEGGTVRIASGLEARYIVAEAEGVNAANLLFVNQRRAIGEQVALPAGTTEAEYQAALRDQRRRDFYLDGHRLGDLRRYLRLYNVNDFPTGSYLGSTTLNYGDQTCLPLNLAEIDNNPNVPKS
ncbi:MAG TPA: hypothetical protein VF613_17440 [Longimicrobium sp.]